MVVTMAALVEWIPPLDFGAGWTIGKIEKYPTAIPTQTEQAERRDQRPLSWLWALELARSVIDHLVSQTLPIQSYRLITNRMSKLSYTSDAEGYSKLTPNGLVP